MGSCTTPQTPRVQIYFEQTNTGSSTNTLKTTVLQDTQTEVFTHFIRNATTTHVIEAQQLKKTREDGKALI